MRNGGKFFQISGIDKFPFIFAGREKKKLISQITDDFHDYLRQSNEVLLAPEKGLACRTDLWPFTVPLNKLAILAVNLPRFVTSDEKRGG